MSWRPDGWLGDSLERLGIPESRTQFLKNVQRLKDYEAGADALLEALRKSGKRITKGEQCFPDRTFSEVCGHIVFIPDD